MSIPGPVRAYRRRAGVVIVAAWVVAIVVAYLTRNGWWFIAWWPVLIGAVLLGRCLGRLWPERGDHEAGGGDATAG